VMRKRLKKVELTAISGDAAIWRRFWTWRATER